ncbi:MAG: hypothetical protein PHQ60_02885 [Sideroxydans sp.]|nr:hypothetical protein [Sideroxydans sp.]
MLIESKLLERWLLLVAFGHIGVGLLMPVIAYSAAFDIYSDLLKPAFWVAQEVTPETKEFQRWMFALFGPTIASVGVFMAYLVKAGAKLREPGSWNALLIVSALWAPGDIGISLLHNFWLHVYIDLAALLVIVPPTLILRARAIEYQKQNQP